MESVLSRIIEIDRMADSRISDAQNESEKILRETELKCSTLKKDIMSAAEKRIEEVEKFNKDDFDSKIADLEAKYSGEKKEMDNYFETGHKEIEEKIFAEIVGE